MSFEVAGIGLMVLGGLIVVYSIVRLMRERKQTK